MFINKQKNMRFNFVLEEFLSYNFTYIYGRYVLCQCIKLIYLKYLVFLIWNINF